MKNNVYHLLYESQIQCTSHWLLGLMRISVISILCPCKIMELATKSTDLGSQATVTGSPRDRFQVLASAPFPRLASHINSHSPNFFSFRSRLHAMPLSVDGSDCCLVLASSRRDHSIFDCAMAEALIRPYNESRKTNIEVLDSLFRYVEPLAKSIFEMPGKHQT